MANIMKIGGQNDSGNAQGFYVTNKGYAKITRLWSTTVTELFNETISDTSPKNTIDNVFNCEEYGFISLRFSNSTDVTFTAIIYSDIGSSTLSNYLRDNSGNPIAFTIPKGQSILTPDDLPILNYLRYFKLRVQANDTPSTPKDLTIQIYAKR